MCLIQCERESRETEEMSNKSIISDKMMSTFVIKGLTNERERENKFRERVGEEGKKKKKVWRGGRKKTLFGLSPQQVA